MEKEEPVRLEDRKVYIQTGLFFPFLRNMKRCCFDWGRFNQRKRDFLFFTDEIPLVILTLPVQPAGKQPNLIRSAFVPLHVVDKRRVYHFISSRSGVVAGKIPVSGIVGAGYMQVFDGLINDFDLGLAIVGF